MATTSTLKRGLSHLFGGLLIPIAALFLPRVPLLLSLGAVTMTFLVFEIIRFRAPGINRWFFSFFRPLLREKETSRLTGTSYMLIGSLLAFIVFQKDIAILSTSFLVVGDAMATNIGKRFGRTRLLGKTLEGDLACLFSCLVTGLVFYLAGLNVPLPTILVGAVGAAIVEAMPLPINDNLTMPLFAGFVMTVMPI